MQVRALNIMSKGDYSSMFKALSAVNSEVEKLSQSQSKLLSHNSTVVTLVDDFKTVQEHLQKASSGKPVASNR